jgi:uncharacterized protein (DUF2235 family)
MNDPREPRQLIVLCDGTNNNLTGGEQDTNVVKLAELLARHGDRHRVTFYDPGVGNPGELPGTTLYDRLQRSLERISGLAFGRGVYENIAEAYRFLMHNWRDGDQIYLFGFSRGAFTARSVAGLVNQFGILRPQMESMLPTLLHTYFSNRHDGRWKRISAQAKRLFARSASRQAEIHYIGVWDTVAAVGMPPFRLQITASADLGGKCYLHVRQALALDEHRAQFKPRLYASANGPHSTRNGNTGSLVQLWFRGTHGSVGGGFPASESVLSDQALVWIVGEAARLGLRLGPPEARLLDEAAIGPAIEAIPPVPEMREPLVHSPVQRNAWWALTGMVQRDTTTIEIEDVAQAQVDAHEHPSVARSLVPGMAISEWLRPRKSMGMWLCLLSLPVWMLALGQLLYGFRASGLGTVADLTQMATLSLHYLRENFLFQGWQLTGLVPALWQKLAVGFASPRLALLFDLGFIACYSYVLAYWASWAFARRSGWRRARQPVSVWMNRLGWALPMAVGCDLLENLFTWATLALWSSPLSGLASLTAGAMAIAAAGKLIGLFGTAVLIVGGFMPKRRAPTAKPAPLPQSNY